MNIDPSNRFHREGAAPASCPHCHARGQMLLVASPDFHTLRTHRPSLTGAVFQCGACGTPSLTQYRVTHNGPDGIQLSLLTRPAEQVDDAFGQSYLPAAINSCLRDALGCYQHGLLLAFAAMCRLTVQAMIAEQGDDARQRLYRQLDEIASIARLSESELRLLRDLLFDTQHQGLVRAQAIDRNTAAVLLETLKDMLQQQYVRPARLRKALRMRRFFAAAEDEQATTTKVAALNTTRSTGTD